uniref:ATP synthase F0 subunit 8 n=1 Tax=Malacocephalus laevis TaxID=630738 RepID=UPI0028FC88C7|nr:ATP synthase F0 subunit 8 [Malacocephalus laevis]WNH37760.1 ATP synthase F0 subunit 8 [Malacocephalus laevis]
MPQLDTTTWLTMLLLTYGVLPLLLGQILNRSSPCDPLPDDSPAPLSPTWTWTW